MVIAYSGSPLDRYLPRLRALAAEGSADTSGLSGFAEDWSRAAGDPRFRAVQDTIADRLTWDPAVAAARRVGIRTPLGVAILFDTAVQHGTSSDPDGLPALIGSAGLFNGDEKAWLLKFLDVRRADLLHPHDEDSRAVWTESVDRVDALRDLVERGEDQLDPPVTLRVDGDSYTLR